MRHRPPASDAGRSGGDRRARPQLPGLRGHRRDDGPGNACHHRQVPGLLMLLLPTMLCFIGMVSRSAPDESKDLIEVPFEAVPRCT